MRNRERWSRSQQTGKLSGEFFCLIFSTSAFPCAGQHSDSDHTSSASMLLPPITPLGKHQAGQQLKSNRSAFYVEYVSIPLCRSAFGYRSYLKCFNVTTANYPLGKHQAGQHLMSNRSAFYVEYVSIPLYRSAFGYRSFHCAGQHSIIPRVFQCYYRQLPSSENIKQVSI